MCNVVFSRLLEMVRRSEAGGSPVAVVEVGSGMLDPRVKVRCEDIQPEKKNSSGEEFLYYLCTVHFFFLPPTNIVCKNIYSIIQPCETTLKKRIRAP